MNLAVPHQCRPAAVCGPLRSFAFGALWLGIVDRVACRVPPRRAGNFGVRITSLREVSGPPLREHLLAQMKVTKAKGLNATPFMRSARCGGPAQRATEGACITSSLRPARRCGASQSLARVNTNPIEPALDPRPKRSEASSSGQVPRSAAKYPVARRAGQARREERTERCCIEPLCFGDFHLGPQMKVTRLPGRDPAGWQSAVLDQGASKTKGRNRPAAARHSNATERQTA